MANSVLVAAPRIDRGWLRPEYVFSRFVADCAKSAGFEAIRYASTKSGDGENYVLLSPEEKSLRSPVVPRAILRGRSNDVVLSRHVPPDLHAKRW
ncbi:RES domain-containing protein [Sinorhizobium medicae]|uniref:RES domain-containing protein n=1 Tax=Sinorhizobium medicae TaxID=110321 RepID=A0A6G1WQU9_9HYPH|nr:RES domain-containing protein [Sinorhizobium medicae]MQX88126.1 RES domain-containing protein [Sinorhizobium medicae]